MHENVLKESPNEFSSIITLLRYAYKSNFDNFRRNANNLPRHLPLTKFGRSFFDALMVKVINLSYDY